MPFVARDLAEREAELRAAFAVPADDAAVAAFSAAAAAVVAELPVVQALRGLAYRFCRGVDRML